METVIDLAAIPREFPQFGKSLSNILRNSDAVFGREGGGCGGGRGCDCGAGCGCGCGNCGVDAVSPLLVLNSSNGRADGGRADASLGGLFANQLAGFVNNWEGGGETSVGCPCDKEEKECRKCIEEAGKADVGKRSVARAKCLISGGLGPCGAYYQCRHAYESLLSDSEKDAFRKRCPPYEYRVGPLNPGSCCIYVKCRDMIGFPLVSHCAIEKVGCDGTSVMYESHPDPGNVPGAPAITKNKPGNENQRWTRMYRKCWDCDESGDEPAECARLNDDFVRSYPGGSRWKANGNNCNAFAGWAAWHLMGISMCGLPFTPGGNRWPNRYLAGEQ